MKWIKNVEPRDRHAQSAWFRVIRVFHCKMSIKMHPYKIAICFLCNVIILSAWCEYNDLMDGWMDGWVSIVKMSPGGCPAIAVILCHNGEPVHPPSPPPPLRHYRYHHPHRHYRQCHRHQNYCYHHHHHRKIHCKNWKIVALKKGKEEKETPISNNRTTTGKDPSYIMFSHLTTHQTQHLRQQPNLSITKHSFSQSLYFVSFQSINQPITHLI